jgi:hypothetical protein
MASSFDPLGDTMGGVSLLAQAFVACTRGFELWQKGEAISEEATYVQVKLGIQAARFEAWGCGWDIEKNTRTRDPKFMKHADLAEDCLNLIKYQINSLETLDTEFPSLKVAANPPHARAMFDILSMLAGPQLRQDLQTLRRRKTVSDVEEKATFQEKFKWAWQDGKVLKKLTILESLIDGLYQLLPPPLDDPVAAIVFNPSLSSTDTTTLDAIGNQSEDSSLQSSLAWLKSTIVKFETRSTFVQDKEIQKVWSRLSQIRNSDSRNSRAVGTYQDKDVLIEWKMVPSSRVPSHGVIIDRRIKDVARLLQSDLKPEELRTLSCIGVVDKIDEEQIRYGLLYSLPSPSTSFSLRDLLNLRKDLFLGDYFTIAQVLSKALLCLHLAGWLHKGIRSDNILFFANDISEVLPAHPYIVGFEYSRAEAQKEWTEELADDVEFNLYRHPDRQGMPIASIEDQSTGPPRVRQSYRAEYDIYGLGVILIELGVRRTAQAIFKQSTAHHLYGTHTPQRFQSWLIDMVVPELGKRMGRLYRDATLLCLQGNFNNTRTLEAAFYIDVVRKLESCNA